MPLPVQPAVPNLNNTILAFINAKSDATVIAQARRLLQIGYVTLLERNIAKKTISFWARNENNVNAPQSVKIVDYYTPSHLKMECTCGAEGICHHKIASLLFIAERLPDSVLPLTPELQAKSSAGKAVQMTEVIIKMPAINFEILNQLTNRYDVAMGTTFSNQKKVNLLSEKNMVVEAEVTNLQTIYYVLLRKNEDETFNTYCNCGKPAPYVCEHRYAVFYTLFLSKGKFYFEFFKDQTVEKNKLLAEYGYTAKDAIDDKFDFAFNQTTGQLELTPKDLSLQKMSEYQNWDAIIKELKIENKPGEPTDVHFPEMKVKGDFGIGFAISFQRPQFPFYTLTPFRAKLNKDLSSPSNSVTAFSCTDPPRDIHVDKTMQKIFYLLQDITHEQLFKVLQNDAYSGYSRRGKSDMFGYIPFKPDELEMLREHIHSRFMQLFPLLEREPYTFIQNRYGNVSMLNLDKINFSAEKLRLVFKLEIKEDTTDLSLMIKRTDDTIMEGAVFQAGMFIQQGDTIFLVNRTADMSIIRYMGKTSKIRVNKKDTSNFIHNFIVPLQKYYDVELPEEIPVTTILPEETKVEKMIYLREVSDKFLVIQPAFKYNDSNIVEYSYATRFMEEQDDKLVLTQRNNEVETAFIDTIRSLHSSFKLQRHQGFFHISFEDALRDRWFFKFYSKMKEQQADIYGLKEMKKFRYNPHSASISFSVGTGIDWFDVKIKITFGDQVVRLKDLRKAVINNQNWVLLNDGSIGMLPEEWAKKYATLFKMGDVEHEALKVSKFHFSIVDEMYDQIDNDKIRQELDDKRNKLKNFSKIEDLEMPEKVIATLRPYQKAGFSWFNFLDEFSWGGILADDMGLGKTLQTLIFIQHLKNKRNSIVIPEDTIPFDQVPKTHLIVCPNSLMFNWENEIHKFCPDLTYLIHHGHDRIDDIKKFAKYDIIITTYGTIRSDIQTFAGFMFHYVILDESQAIKNPASKSAKAIQLLKSKNRLALTGTPLQNNIFDLYSQMNILNPGMLGNMEFFKKEFATPIDKQQDDGKKDLLKKLIYPFFLRRTKEQVAEDLPSKTEIVLYCDMGDEQRKVYDAFRNDFRDRIMKRIATEGLEKSGIYVLQGLMKLRQVCDSPGILKEDEIFSHESVKLEELTRELIEITGEHKVLVFSQFIGMLKLIKTRLEVHGIKYAYLDGQSTDRKESVEMFQANEECKVFLISLKAGGVGLNLTAADYVYIVDPWWNPAVEQQAIDRTHRIGQTRNIFAYRMICKNTIEEKILQLQEDKRTFAKEIISDDRSFLKNLNKEDIEYLFS